MKINVRLTIYNMVLDADTGIQYESAVATNLEGCLQDFSDRLTGQLTSPQPVGILPSPYKLLVKRKTLMANATYQDNVATYLKEGFLVKVTQRRHPLLKCWVTESANRQFLVSHVNESDFYGEWLDIGLKEVPR